MSVDVYLDLAWPLLLGAALLRALGLGFSSDRLAFFGWAWVCGALGTGALLFAWMWCSPDLSSPWTMRAVLLALTGVGFWIGRKRVVQPPLEVPPAGRGERTFFSGVVGLLFLALFVRLLLATLSPVLIDDEAEFWALKAKVLWHTEGFGAAFREEMSEPTFVYNKDYPLLNPLLQLWTFVNAGKITHVVNRVPIQLFNVALWLILAAALRRLLRPLLAAGFLVMLFALDESHYHARLAAGDLLAATGLVCALDGWLRWRDGGGRWFALVALGLTLVVWSKNEGLLVAFSIGLGALVVWALGRFQTEGPRGRRLPLPRLALPLFTLAGHVAFNEAHGFRSGFLSNPTREGNVIELLVAQGREYLPVVLGHYGTEIFFAPWHSHYALPILGVLLVLFPLQLWRSRLLLPALVAVFSVAGVIAVFVGAPHEIDKHLRTAAGRVTYQLVPAVFLWLAAVLQMLSTRDESIEEGARP